MKRIATMLGVITLMCSSVTATMRGTELALEIIDSQLREAGVDASFQDVLFGGPCLSTLLPCAHGANSFNKCRLQQNSCESCIAYAIFDCGLTGFECNWTTFEIQECYNCAWAAHNADEDCVGWEGYTK